jgi:hypothetical protein
MEFLSSHGIIIENLVLVLIEGKYYYILLIGMVVTRCYRLLGTGLLVVLLLCVQFVCTDASRAPDKAPDLPAV